MVRFPKGDAIVSKEPVSACVLFSLAGGNGFKERGVTQEDNFVSHYFRKIWDWWSEQVDFVCLHDEMLMDLEKSFRSQSLAECVEGIVCGDIVVTDTDGFAIDPDLTQFVTEFSIG